MSYEIKCDRCKKFVDKNAPFEKRSTFVKLDEEVQVNIFFSAVTGELTNNLLYCRDFCGDCQDELIKILKDWWDGGTFKKQWTETKDG